jgi:hypothetical protein
MVYALVFFFLGVKFHQNVENINFIQGIFCYNILSFFLEKMLNFEEKKLIFLGPHLDSDFYLLAFFKLVFKIYLDKFEKHVVI